MECSVHSNSDKEVHVSKFSITLVGSVSGEYSMLDGHSTKLDLTKQTGTAGACTCRA